LLAFWWHCHFNPSFSAVSAPNAPVSFPRAPEPQPVFDDGNAVHVNRNCATARSVQRLKWWSPAVVRKSHRVTVCSLFKRHFGTASIEPHTSLSFPAEAGKPGLHQEGRRGREEEGGGWRRVVHRRQRKKRGTGHEGEWRCGEWSTCEWRVVRWFNVKITRRGAAARVESRGTSIRKPKVTVSSTVAWVGRWNRSRRRWRL
jgi:hypothetical protein